MSRGSTPSQERVDREFMWSAWDYSRAIEETFAVGITITLLRHKQRGSWYLRLSAAPSIGDEGCGTVASTTRPWPSSQVASLAAALYQLHVKLDQVLASRPILELLD